LTPLPVYALGALPNPAVLLYLASMHRRRIYLVGGLCLLVVWTATALGTAIADRLTPRAAGIRELLRSNSFAQLGPLEREGFLRLLAAGVNELQPDERQQAQLSPEMQALYRHMVAAERLQYLAWTRPPGTGQMARAFDAMQVDRQRRHLGVALSDLQEKHPRFGDPAVASGIMAEIQRRGLAAAVDDEVTQRDLELQPVVEQTRRVLQTAR
jgi:hypothetical protein